NILNRGKREQRPSMYRQTPYVEQAPTTVLPKERGNKNKNKIHKATILPLNLENIFDDDNEGSDDIMFVGGQFTGNILVYENVDSNKIIGNLPVARLTPDDTEAQYDWWVSSKAYFDGVIDQAERVPHFLNRQNMFEVPSDFYRDFKEMRKKDAEREKMYEQMRKFMEGMNVGLGGRSSFQTQTNNSFLNMGKSTNWQTPMSSQPGSTNWQSQMAAQSATPFMQPAISSHPGTYNWQSQIPSHMVNLNSQTPIETHPDAVGLLDQRPSMYRQTPYVEQAPTTVLPKERGNKNKNKIHKATILPLNLENIFDDDNEGSDDIMFVGGQFTGAAR
nr:hypothetical protein [Tanacetum cinerariifolium]